MCISYAQISTTLQTSTIQQQMTNLKMNKENFLKQEQAKDDPDTKVIEKLEKEIKELTGILTKANIDRQTNINNVINMKKKR